MKKGKEETTMQRIRRLEEEISYASPKRAAKIVGEIVRLKSTIFD